MVKPLHALTCAALAACVAMPVCTGTATASQDEENSHFESAARALRAELAPALTTFDRLEAQRNATTGDIANARVQGLQDVMYDGLPEKPTVTLKLDDLTLREGRDFIVQFEGDTVNPGTVLVHIEGAGGYTGSIDTSFTIVPGNLSHAEVDVIPDQRLTAESKPVEPAPTVSLNGNPLVEGEDYTVSYANNAAPGAATMLISGMGNCVGETHASFEIVEDSASFSEHSPFEQFTATVNTYAPAAIAGIGAVALGAWQFMRTRRRKEH